MKTTTTLALALSLAAATLVADIMHRAPTPQEKAAMEKAFAAITKVVNSFPNADWYVVSQFHPKTDDVNAEPASPLDTSLNYNLKYGVKDGSPLFKTKIMPVIASIQKAMDAKDYAGAQKAGEATNGTMDFTVDTEVNRLNVRAPGPKITKIQAKGATVAYASTAGAGWEVVVGVGDWAHATAAPNYLNYKFKNSKGSPHIENIVFVFRARRPAGFGADRIRQIVSATDWSQLNAGLTR